MNYKNTYCGRQHWTIYGCFDETTNAPVAVRFYVHRVPGAEAVLRARLRVQREPLLGWPHPRSQRPRVQPHVEGRQGKEEHPGIPRKDCIVNQGGKMPKKQKFERINLNLDRAQLEKAMKKAVAEGVDLDIATSQSALVRALIEAYLKEGA